MIVAGETSGELYGALLAAALKKRRPGHQDNRRWRREDAAGRSRDHLRDIQCLRPCRGDLVSSRQSRKTFAKAVNALQMHKPDLLVLIDYPDFNLKLAAEARKNNIKVLYYVSPQVWAWRKKRVTKIARLVDRMAVVLPFEEEIYKTVGLPCEFVGHPVYDEIRNLPTEKNAAEG